MREVFIYFFINGCEQFIREITKLARGPEDQGDPGLGVRTRFDGSHGARGGRAILFPRKYLICLSGTGLDNTEHA